MVGERKGLGSSVGSGRRGKKEKGGNLKLGRDDKVYGDYGNPVNFPTKARSNTKERFFRHASHDPK